MSRAAQSARDIVLGIDRRQRLAASLLLTAFDLPARATLAAEQILEAANITPDLALDELIDMSDGMRRYALEAARDLIDQMLEEIAD